MKRWLRAAWLRSLLARAFRTPDRPSRRRTQRLTFVGLEDRLTPAVDMFHATRLPLQGDVRPAAVAVADFNGDGRPDLAVAGQGASAVAVILNQSTSGASFATFSAQQTFAVGRAPSALAVGDFNSDGRPDLAVANGGDNTVSVLLNQTPRGVTIGVFAPQQAFATGDSPSSVAVGDFNGDGRPDLAAANRDGSVTLLPNRTPQGNTVGVFGAQRVMTTGLGPSSIAVGDFNGDGLPDLVVANQFSNDLTVLLQKVR